ncbi:MAG: hypothetical protein FIB07_04345 [Candidatus Methanoperedens sp.]|nr:hypothetical protein [Candidatus Methanoperedens sp.]
MTEKLKHVYVLFLLIVVILLVYLVQGISYKGTVITKEIEFNRVDGYNDMLGNITQISILVNNKDMINHNYTISVFTDSDFFSNETVEVFPNMPFTYSATIPLAKKFNADNELVNDPTHSVNFTIYRDYSEKPIDSIEFKFE